MIAWLDVLRARLLRATLRIPFCREVFFDRPKRLLLFFALSLAVNLLVAGKWPLWALLLGPLVLGVPHLGSTVRYVPRLTGELSPGRLALPASLLVLGVGAFRIFGGVESNHLELGLGLASAILLAWATRARAPRAAVAVGGFGALVAVGLAWPAQTLGLLVLAHNFVAFGYWFLRARERADRRVAFVAFMAFALASVAILSGALDGFLATRPLSILGGRFDELAIGQGIFPDLGPRAWFRAISAYAFGQGMHYFVWLKAIPELELRTAYPVSFAQTVRLLRRELGTALPIVIGALTVALAGLMGALSLPEVRDIYLAGAAFHGYFELAGLPLVRRLAAAAPRASATIRW